MRYDVRNATALAVVKEAAGHAAGYEQDLSALTTTLTSLEGALKHSEAVVAAIGGYMEQEAQPQLKGIFGHTGSAITHTSEAIAYYAEGSDLMAADAARNSARVDVPATLPGRAGGPTR